MSASGRHTALSRLHDESGVVAVVVALSMSTFLLGFAALALDLGTAYTRKADLQSIADRLAVATASGLPTVSGSDPTTTSPGAQQTFRTAFAAECDNGGREIWPAAYCPAPGQPTDAGWAFDGDRGNGEVEFVNDPTGALSFLLPSSPDALPATAQAVRVLLPPSTVEFGFTALVGKSSTDIQASSSARIGTPLGSGILPFALTAQDVTNGQFCVVDPSVGTASSTISPPAVKPFFLTAPWTSVNPTSVPAEDGASRTVTITLHAIFGGSTYTDLKVFSSVQPGMLDSATAGAGKVSVELPQLQAGATIQLWLTGRQNTFGGGNEPFVSYSVTVRYTGVTEANNPCALPQASTRGYVDLARSTAGDALVANTRVSPQVQLYPAANGLIDGVTGFLGNTLDLCVTNLFSPATSCAASTVGVPFSDRLADGLFDGGQGQDGRLMKRCGSTEMSMGGNDGVEAQQLFADGSALVDASKGSATQLRSKILTHAAITEDQRGWINSGVMRCARLAVMPVVDPNPLNPVAGLLGGKPILSFAYVWIDGPTAARGVTFNSGQLRSMRGYIIDPKYLPQLVAGAGVIGPYLGAQMPKEATLICDLSTDDLEGCSDAD